MVDIHSHLLPEIDDGARDVQTSEDILCLAVQGGFTDIICTPHFSPDEQNMREFLEFRQESFNLLSRLVEKKKIPINLHLGLEIAFTPELINLVDSLKNEVDFNILDLCLANSRYMLLEFNPLIFPIWAEHNLYELQLRGVIPVIAHVDRYSWVLRQKEFLSQCSEKGVIFQVNASSIDSLCRSKESETVDFLLSNNYIDVVASDAHNNNDRGMLSINAIFRDENSKKYGKSSKWIENGFNILNNHDTISTEHKLIKKNLFGILKNYF